VEEARSENGIRTGQTDRSRRPASAGWSWEPAVCSCLTASLVFLLRCAGAPCGFRVEWIPSRVQL